MFETLEIPSEIIAPKYRNGLGRTAITINGFVDQLYAQIPEETVDGDQPQADQDEKSNRASSNQRGTRQAPIDPRFRRNGR